MTALCDSLDDCFALVDVQLRGRKIVEEEQRSRTDGDDVVHAHRNEVDADGVVATELECELELGADSVGSRHEHRIFDVARDGAETREPPERAEDVLGASRLGKRLDSLNELVARFDVDARVAIGQPRHAREARRSVEAGQRAVRR